MNDNLELVIKALGEHDKLDKLKRYHILNRYVKKNQILFTGSSLMEQFPIYELKQDFDICELIYNRGIGGYTTEEMLQAMDIMVFDLEPSKIFINIGSNDLNAEDYLQEEFITRYERILIKIKDRLPQVKIYVMAYYPMNEEYNFGNEMTKSWMLYRTNARINEANIALENMAQRNNVRFININENLYDENGNLKQEFSVEGIHMYANGYRAVLDELMRYVKE